MTAIYCMFIYGVKDSELGYVVKGPGFAIYVPSIPTDVLVIKPLDSIRSFEESLIVSSVKSLELGIKITTTSTHYTYHNIRGIILEKVCKYLYHKVRYTNTTGEVPELKIEPELALELLMSGEYLDC
jgi:hypothetical protein